MPQYISQLQVKALLTYSPARFFHKINQLDWYRDALRDWTKETPLPKAAKILELACETGSLTAYLDKQGYHVTGLDLSEKMISHARKNHPKLDFKVADASQLPFEENTFDAVLAASLINIAPQAPLIIKEMARVCKPAGAIKILVPAKGFDDDDLEVLIKQLRISGFSEAALRAWHRYPPKMSPDEVNHLLSKAGLHAEQSIFHLNKMLLSLTAFKS